MQLQHCQQSPFVLSTGSSQPSSLTGKLPPLPLLLSPLPFHMSTRRHLIKAGDGDGNDYFQAAPALFAFNS
jgi:hypothetical protein